jgi:hypothetical protein
MYIYENPSMNSWSTSERGFEGWRLGQPQTNQISFIEAEVTTRQEKDGRPSISYRRLGNMDPQKVALFIKRFCDPILKYEVGRKLIAAVRSGKHPVEIAWDNGKFGFNGTIATDRAAAQNGRGSAAVIFIDQKAPDLAKFPIIQANPDVGLFHELLHAWHTQNGTVVDDQREMERRIVGMGDFINAKGTENDYRAARNLDRRCCWEKEKLSN